MSQANPATPAEAEYWDGKDEREAAQVSIEDMERIYFEEVMGTPGPEDEPAKNTDLRLRLRKSLKEMEARGVTPTLPNW